MRKPRIAILGATGVVGREITSITTELGVEFETIKFLSSAKSAGTKLEFQGKEYTVEEAKPESFDGVDIVMASAGGGTSKLFAPEIVKRGGVIIDNSSAFRMEEDVPLVIAGVNDEDLRKHKGIIANPNCSTSQLMLVLKPLHEKAKIKRLIVSTYQAVSGAGLKAMKELAARINRDKSTTTVLVRKLENAGRVKIESDPADKRNKLLSLTAKGAEYNQMTQKLSQELLETFYKGFNENEKKQFCEFLDRIKRNFE